MPYEIDDVAEHAPCVGSAGCLALSRDGQPGDRQRRRRPLRRRYSASRAAGHIATATTSSAVLAPRISCYLPDRSCGFRRQLDARQGSHRRAQPANTHHLRRCPPTPCCRVAIPSVSDRGSCITLSAYAKGHLVGSPRSMDQRIGRQCLPSASSHREPLRADMDDRGLPGRGCWHPWESGLVPARLGSA